MLVALVVVSLAVALVALVVRPIIRERVAADVRATASASPRAVTSRARGASSRDARAETRRVGDPRLAGIAPPRVSVEAFSRLHPTDAIRVWGDFNRALHTSLPGIDVTVVVIFSDAEIDELLARLSRHQRPDAERGDDVAPVDAYAPALLEELTPRERRLLTDIGFFDVGPLSPPTAEHLVLDVAALADPSRPPGSDSDGDE